MSLTAKRRSKLRAEWWGREGSTTVFLLLDALEASEARCKKLEAALRDALTDIDGKDKTSIWQHRCSDRVGGCTAISEDVLRGMRARMRAALEETP